MTDDRKPEQAGHTVNHAPKQDTALPQTYPPTIESDKATLMVRFQDFLEAVPDAMMIVSPDGQILDMNAQMLRLFGYAREELCGQSAEILLPERLRAVHPQHRAGYFADPRVRPMGSGLELLGLHRDGREFPVEIRLSVLETKESVLTLAVIRDIAERKQAEVDRKEMQHALKRERDFAHELVATAPVIILLLDPEGNIEYINPFLEELSGWSLDEVRGKKWFETFLPERDHERITRLFHTAASGEPTRGNVNPILTRAGEEREIEWYDRGMRDEYGNHIGLLCIGQDVTERKRAEETIRSNEDRLRVALGTIDAAVFQQDTNLRYIWMYQPQLGYTTNQVLGKMDVELLPFEAASQATEIKRRVLKSGLPARGEVTVRWNDHVGYYDLLVEPLMGADGQIIGITGSSLNITERWHMDQALRQREAQLNEAQRIAKVGSWTLDLTTDVLTWSDETFRIFEMDRAKIADLNEGFQNLVHPEDRIVVRTALDLALETHQSYEITHRLLMPDGRIKYVHERAEILYDNADLPILFIGTVQDITERKQLQEQLFEAQKLESLGKLAGGIAHDFNNLLTAIMGYTDLAQSGVTSDSDVGRFLVNVQAAAQRASTLTNQLLMYARRQMVEFSAVNLNKVILEIDPLLRRTIGEAYELVLSLEEQLWSVKSNVSQLEQVLINLIVNARDSMPNGGRILVETANVPLDEDYTEVHPGVAPGEYAMFAVSDNGSGMTEETMARIFEPFFTTKEIGKGTGLGLATCYGIIKQSGGNISVVSELGQGTSFKVYLPRLQSIPVSEEAVSQEYLPSGTETILLVDDEPMVRDIAARILRTQGYRVMEASNAAEAMYVQNGWEDTIDLLLTDVVMPLMGGKELAQRLQESRPDIKVLYLSGYTHDVILDQGILKPDVALITKPFVASDLVKKVREVLNAG